MSLLVKSISVILAQYIIAEELMTKPSLNSSWPLYISYMPDVKNDLGAIEDGVGKKLGRYMVGDVIQRFGITIKIRSSVYKTGWVKMESILKNLDKIDSEEITVNGIDYII